MQDDEETDSPKQSQVEINTQLTIENVQVSDKNTFYKKKLLSV